MSYWLAFGIPTVVLLLALVYGVWRAGWFSPKEQRRLDANTRMAQRQDDPKKPQQSPFVPETAQTPSRHSFQREPNGVEPDFSEEDIQRAQFGPRGVPGGPDPARMTPQRRKKTPRHIDPGHTA